MTQRFEGRNLEEALTAAASVLGVERHKIVHRVLVEKRGFLGGMKRIVIEAEVDESAAPPPAPVVAAPLEPAYEAPVAAPASERRERGRGGRSRRGREDRGGGGGRGARRERHRPSDLEPGVFTRYAEYEAPEQGPESEGAASVRKWCERVMDLGRFDIAVRTTENDERIDVQLYGPDAGRFIDRHGELLDAVQVLANKALVGRAVEKDVEFDCEEFKEKRTADLESRARELADRVRAERREQLLPAMSPIERRIVHLALADDPDVTTDSRGEGFYKRVAIVLRPQSEPQP